MATKQKTNRSAAKRFKIKKKKGGGLVALRNKIGRRHMMRNKTKKVKRQGRTALTVSKSDMNKVISLLKL
jgi:ribosomal protein L35